MGKRSSDIIMKQCDVCCKAAVGFHYGAYVCEACKKFFVRHASGVSKLYGSCQVAGSCNLTLDGRGKCQHCRFKRCLDVGMKIDNRSSNYDLTTIPCQVCGAKSSGLHFGCITCEGCKGFFRRTYKLHGHLVCFNDNKCKLNSKTRNMCKRCRLEKCLKIGMSRTGIKIGRHPNYLKFKCLKSLQSDQTSTSSKSSEKEFQTFDDPVCPVKSDDTAEPSLEQLDETVGSAVASNCYLENSSLLDMKSEMEESKTLDEISDNMITDYFEETFDQNVVESPITTYKSDQQENILSEVTYMETPPNDPVEIGTCEIQSMLQAACTFLSQKHVVFQPSVIRNNMLQSSDTIHNVWSKMMDNFVFHSKFVVKFAKLMPGFSSLSLPDKKAVIKESLYPLILLELSQDYYEVNGGIAFNYFDFSMSDRAKILTHFPEFIHFADHVKQVGCEVHRLHFTNLELTLLCGIMMFYNYSNLTNWAFSRSMFYLFQNYLCSYFKNDREMSINESGTRFHMCKEVIRLLNDMNRQHNRIIYDFRQLHKELQYPELYTEVFNN